MGKKTWKEFKDSGLLWWINTQLHMFGWNITFNLNKDGDIVEVYPARCNFRGFSKKSNDNGYTKVTKYLKDNIEELNDELKTKEEIK